MRVAELLSEGRVVGWFRGRMEFGPRALGARSILGGPRSREMQSQMNLKIEHRELPALRPERPARARERVVRARLRLAVHAPRGVGEVGDAGPGDGRGQSLFGIARLNVECSQIPAVTHVDYSARV